MRRTMGATATLTSKGQTTIPKEIRDRLGMKPGDRITFTLMADGTVLVRVKRKSILDGAAERSDPRIDPRACRRVAQEGTQGSSHRTNGAVMLGLDTNVLVRYLVRDNEAQFERARRLIRRTAAAEGVFVSLLVLQETEWVLRSRYDLSKAEIG